MQNSKYQYPNTKEIQNAKSEIPITHTSVSLHLLRKLRKVLWLQGARDVLVIPAEAGMD
jgi:hypothetical protein